MNLPSYPKIWNIGHPSIRTLFQGPVVIQEKVDGSQFSFGLDSLNGDGTPRVVFRSKGAEVYSESPGMFKAGVEAVQLIADKLTPGWVYRGEYLSKPKHNALAYSRVPFGNIILFDITIGPQAFLSASAVVEEAARLAFEVVPLLASGTWIETADQLRVMLNLDSCLGGCKIEGVVVKNYDRFHEQTGDVMFGKFVSEAFKEVHKGEWKIGNPQKADILALLIATVGTERRWEKAVEHRRDCGLLESAPQDIGPLVHAVQQDVEEECVDEIKAALYAWAWPQIKRRVANGLPEWYKQRLLTAAFEPVTEQGVGD